MNTVIRVEPGITSLILVNSFINNFVSKPCPFKISSTIIFHSKMNKSSPLPNLGLSQSQRPPVPVAIFNTRVKPKAVHAQTEKKKTIRIIHEVPPPPKIEAESIAVRFFNNHPDATVDPRPLEEKISDIDNLFLESQVEDDNIFELLVQKKSMCELLYGEESVETIIASIQLGAFYNKIEKFQSAYRHLKTAYDISSQYVKKLAIQDQLFLSVEYVQTLLELGFQSEDNENSANVINNAHLNKNIKTKIVFNGDYSFEIDDDKLNLAENILFPFKNVENKDNNENKIEIFYRRDLYIAQLKMCRRKFKKALKYYEKAIDTYLTMLDKERRTATQVELSSLYLNAGLMASEIKEKDVANCYFQKSRTIFIEAGLTIKVQEIDSYITTLNKKKDFEEEEEEEINEVNKVEEEEENNNEENLNNS